MSPRMVYAHENAVNQAAASKKRRHRALRQPKLMPQVYGCGSRFTAGP